MGKYRLAPEFQKSSVSPVERFIVLPSFKQTKITKRLSVTVEESGPTCGVAAGMLNQIWHDAEEIPPRHKIVHLGEGVHCVTEY